jgi:hypothetical protein
MHLHAVRHQAKIILAQFSEYHKIHTTTHIQKLDQNTEKLDEIGASLEHTP